jgi:hypothetical protein
MSSTRINLPDRNRKYFPGTTAGDTIVDVAVPELGQEWQVTWAIRSRSTARSISSPSEARAIS